MSTISSEEIISILKEKIENYDAMCQEQEPVRLSVSVTESQRSMESIMRCTARS